MQERISGLMVMSVQDSAITIIFISANTFILIHAQAGGQCAAGDDIFGCLEVSRRVANSVWREMSI